MARIFLFLLPIIFWNSPATAAEYYWYSVTKPSVGSFPSPTAACQAFVSQATYGGKPVTYSRVFRSTDTRFTCVYLAVNAVGQEFEVTTSIARSGDSCPPDTTYNQQTGACESPEPDDDCKDTLGQSVDHEFNRGPIADPSQRNAPPPEICQNACQFENSGVVKTCKRFLAGENLEDVFCTVVYNANGQSCTAGNPAPGSNFDQPPTKPPAKADPAFSKDSSCDDWQTDEFGLSARSCYSTSESKDPGKLECDGDSCKAGVPPPKYEKTEVEKTTEKKTNPDGSTDSTTNTSTKKTTCKGAEPCKETGKEETETEGTDADGEPKSGEYDCVGTDCKGEESEEEEEPSKVSGESCDATISCEGDAVQCAILQKQKDQACAFEESQNWDDNKQKVTDLFQGEQYEVQEETIQVPSFIGSGTRFLTGSCPAPRTVTLLSGPRLELEFAPFCTFAEMLAPVIVACALLFGALYVGRGMGA